jgi:hypothetical protein
MKLLENFLVDMFIFEPVEVKGKKNYQHNDRNNNIDTSRKIVVDKKTQNNKWQNHQYVENFSSHL